MLLHISRTIKTNYVYMYAAYKIVKILLSPCFIAFITIINVLYDNYSKPKVYYKYMND